VLLRLLPVRGHWVPLGVRRRGTTVAFLNSSLLATVLRGNRRAAPAFADVRARRPSGGAPSRYDGRVCKFTAFRGG